MEGIQSAERVFIYFMAVDPRTSAGQLGVWVFFFKEVKRASIFQRKCKNRAGVHIPVHSFMLLSIDLTTPTALGCCSRKKRVVQ